MTSKDNERTSVDEVAAIADGLLGLSPTSTRWSTLRESSRSIVLRGEGVIVKHAFDHGTTGFHELQALRVARENAPGTAPSIINVDEPNGVVVIEDFGDGPSLADALLGDDERQATNTLNHYVDAVATLHERTIGEATENSLNAAWYRDVTERAIEALAAHPFAELPALSDAAMDDARALVSLLTGPGVDRVFSFGDMCPDNNVMTADGMRLFDLEGAGFASPALDLANITMPFPTCWCCLDLPEATRSAAVDRYCTAVGSTTALTELPLAHSLFGFLTVGMAAPRVIDNDEPIDEDSKQLMSTRTRVLTRLARAAESLPDASTSIPALAAWLELVYRSLADAWHNVAPARLAPAFR